MSYIGGYKDQDFTQITTASNPGSGHNKIYFKSDNKAYTLTSAGTEVALAQSAAFSRSFVLTTPTSATDGPIWRVPASITITNIHVLCMDGTNIVGNLWEYDSNGANGSTVDADITGTAGTSVDDDGSLSNPGITGGNYLGWKTTSVSGSVTKVIVTFEYTVD